MKIYIVMGSSGEYSDHTEWNIIATKDEVLANKITSDLKEILEFKCSFAKREREEWEEPYDRDMVKFDVIEKPQASNKYKRLQTIPKHLKTEADKADFQAEVKGHNLACQKWHEAVM